MRVLFVHSNADLYGASRSLLRLAGRLARDGNTVLAVLPYDGPLRPALAAAGVEVMVRRSLALLERRVFRNPFVALWLLLRWPFSVAGLVRVIRGFKPGLVHTNTAVIADAPLAARLAGVPHVQHVREFFTEFGAPWRPYRAFLLACAGRMVCVSTPVADQFGGACRVVVIHNGFPRDEFPPVPADRVEAFRARFGLAGLRAVGVVGRIKAGRKGQDVFVRAAALLRDRRPDLRFLLVGSPFPGNESHLARVLALARELGVADRVVYTGDVEDVHAAYAALEAVVLPSVRPEPFGGVVVEAMALGRPVIGTAIGGTVEQVAGGETGILVPPGDATALAAAIERLLADPGLAARMGAAGRERFLARFEFEPFYARMKALYGELAGGPA